jgi:sodium/potassium-transporting ATPase subunit alpha
MRVAPGPSIHFWLNSNLSATRKHDPFVSVFGRWDATQSIGCYSCLIHVNGGNAPRDIIRRSKTTSVFLMSAIANLSVAEALISAGSSPTGLSAQEAARRLRQYGPNRVEKLARQPWPLRLLQEFTQLFSTILWIAAALCFVAEAMSPGEGMARIGYALMFVILISGLFSFWQEYRNERTLAALQQLLPDQVMVMRDGALTQLTIDRLVIGDIILLAGGDSVPADCRLIEAFDVRVNDATLTGESYPKLRDARCSDETSALRSRNALLAGTSLVSGEAKAVVFATGGQTEFGRIAHLTQVSGMPVSPLRRELAHLSRMIAALAVTIGVCFFVIGTLVGIPFWHDIIFSIGVIVAVVPEGLLPTLTLSLVLAAKRMAKRNVLVRHLTSVETLGCATVICTDKTGTLTEDRMQVHDLLLGLERHPVADAILPQIAERHQAFFLAASLCQSLHETCADGQTRLIGDAMEVALVTMGRTVVPHAPQTKRVDEISFDAERRRQSVVFEAPFGNILYCKGAPESLLPLCSGIAEAGRVRPLDEVSRAQIVEAQDAMAERGLRVLALATRTLPEGCAHSDYEQDMTFLGLIGLEDPPRSDVPDAIGKCRAAGIKVIMVTGDHPRTARAIARQIGLAQTPRVVTGSELANLSAGELQFLLDGPEIIFARVAADQKRRIVEALKAMHHIVAVTGDGVNDAPALKSAHIGIAMGKTGSDVAKQAADMVLLEDNFADIVHAIEEGRAVFQNIRKFLTYVLVHDVAELVPYLAFGLFAIPLPLTPIQALSIDMGTDSLTALGLGLERPGPETMRLRPRDQNERLLNRAVTLRAFFFLGAIEAAAAMAAYFFVLISGGWHYGQILPAHDPLYLQATTACLSAIIVLQIVTVFSCRSAVRSAFSMPFGNNHLILYGVAFEAALLLIYNYLPAANWLLDTTAIPPVVWLIILPIAVIMLTLEEGRKAIVRSFLHKNRETIRS